MAKNKSVKRQKSRPASKKSAAVKKSSPASTFFETPALLAARLDKNISALKKSDSKLKTSLSKTQSQVKKAQAKIVSLTRSHANKKQLTTAKKVLLSFSSSLNTLNKEQDNLAKSLASLLEQKSKFIALDKYLAQFEKDWSKKSKLKKSKAKVKARSRKKPVQHPAELDNIEPLSIKQAETSHNDVATEEDTEIAA